MVLPCDGADACFGVCGVGLEPQGKPRVQYEALSYHWGEPVEGHAIICFDTETKTSFRFKSCRNLHNASVSLHKLRPGVPIWADAICINQSDLIINLFSIAKSI